MSNAPATSSSDAQRQANAGPLSPNSQDFMAMLQREFSIQMPTQSGGPSGDGSYNFNSMSGMGVDTPPLDDGAQGFAFGGPAGMAASGSKPQGTFNVDQFLPFTNGTAPGMAALQQPSSATGQVGLNTLARGQHHGSASSGGMQGYPAYGVHTPEGSTDRAEGSTSGAGSPEMRESPTGAGSSAVRQNSASGSKPKAPTKKNSAGRGTIARELRPEEQGEAKGQAHVKRKAGSTEDVAMHEEDESEGDDDDDNEPSTSKRKATSAASRRKSTATSAAAGGAPEVSKAIKRKEQNRAAQKAFRERREQRVKDLEDKVKDLEEKSFGQSIENENLRQLLSKLQQENVKLQQGQEGGFSFAGPMPTMSDLNAGNLEALQPIRSNSSGHSDSQLQPVKPPTPPTSVHDSQRKSSSTSLASKDASPGQMNNGATPASTASKSTSDSSPANPLGSFFGGDGYGGFSGGVFSNAEAGNNFAMGTNLAPPAPQPLQPPSQPQNQFAKPMQPWASTLGGPSFSMVDDSSTPFTVLSFNPANTSYRDDTPFGNMGGGLGFGSLDYRDPSGGAANTFDNMDSFANLQSFDDLNDDAMNELLNSLNAPVPPTGLQNASGSGFSVTSDGTHVMNTATEHNKYFSPPNDAMDTGSDLLNAYFREAFPSGSSSASGATPQVQSQQLRQQSTSTSVSGQSNPFVSPTGSGFSPSNYFTFSPQAEGSPSTAPTSQPGSTGRDSSSPGQMGRPGLVPVGRTNPLAVGTLGPRDMCDSKRVVGKNGEFLTQQDMWNKLQEKLDMSDGLDLDDLCGHFKTCGLGGADGPVVPEACLDKALDKYAEKKREAQRALSQGA